MKPLKIALTKGRLLKNTVEIFELMGIDCGDLKKKTRKLIVPLDDNRIEVVLAKAPDVITYVNHGVCDLGVVGKDTILEYVGSFYEILDLGFGKCRLCLISPSQQDFFGGYKAKTVATKYPAISKRYFENLNMDVKIIKIEGSVELSPIIGLSDAVVDVVETGATLKENGLYILDDVACVSARLISNIASLKLRKDEIERFAEKIQATLKA